MRKLIKENGFLHDLLDASFFEHDIDKNVYYYLRRDSSGRDFYNYIPLQYITEDEWEDIFEHAIDDMGIEDYDWANYSIEEVTEWLEENLDIILIEECS